MRRLNRRACTAFVLFVCTVASVRASDGLLPIPKWFPTEPGATIEYQTSEFGQITGRVVAEVREVTHLATAYSASVHLSVNIGKGNAVEWDVDFAYEPEVLRVTAVGQTAVFKNVLPENSVGDVIEITLPGVGEQLQPRTVDAEIASATTKVAIGDARWDEALVVVGEVPERGVTFKLLLSPPEGVIRLAARKDGQIESVVELVPRRRPFK